MQPFSFFSSFVIIYLYIAIHTAPDITAYKISSYKNFLCLCKGRTKQDGNK